MSSLGSSRETRSHWAARTQGGEGNRAKERRRTGRFVQEKEVLAERAGLGRALRAASRDRELSVWFRAGGIRSSPLLPPAREWGGKERGEGGAAARARVSDRPQEEPLAALARSLAPEVQRQSGAAAAPLLPVSRQPRSGTSGHPGGAAGTPRLRRRPARALCGSFAPREPATQGVAWVGCLSSDRLLSPASPNLLRAANSIKIKPPRKV
ncbi:hypothetical protein NN561_017515 [Cricetulus griseus]